MVSLYVSMFLDEVWETISLEAKDLIAQMLCPEAMRVSAHDALKH